MSVYISMCVQVCVSVCVASLCIITNMSLLNTLVMKLAVKLNTFQLLQYNWYNCTAVVQTTHTLENDVGLFSLIGRLDLVSCQLGQGVPQGCTKPGILVTGLPASQEFGSQSGCLGQRPSQPS